MDGAIKVIRAPAAAQNEARGQAEPIVILFGVDPTDLSGFTTDFVTLDGEEVSPGDLANDEIYINESAADELDTEAGETVTLRTETPADKVYITRPDGRQSELLREGQNAFTFSDADRLGFYDMRLKRDDEQPAQRFAVNLFDTRESNLAPAAEVKISHENVTGKAAWEPARREVWKWILLVALGVLLFEWYVYNKRVYL